MTHLKITRVAFRWARMCGYWLSLLFIQEREMPVLCCLLLTWPTDSNRRPCCVLQPWLPIDMGWDDPMSHEITTDNISDYSTHFSHLKLVSFASFKLS